MAKKKAKRPWLSLLKKHGKGPIVEEGLVAVNAPSTDKVVIKEVPAKVDGVVVGTAQIYEDGTVGIIIDDNAPQWAKDKIKMEADLLGYRFGMED